mgnify:FL=1
MITKAELLSLAQEKSLRPDIVEKDYVLGWVLAGISAHPKLKNDWLFKGGTCLKKCFFETFRFSEDLDFTLTNSNHLDPTFLQSVFSQISEWVYEHSGIEMPESLQSFEVLTNSRGHLIGQGKIAYQGPISPKPLPRIKIDLVATEKITSTPIRASVFHPYSDQPQGGIHVLSYAYEEIFAEKVRALIDRTRPRDLYDVVCLFINSPKLPKPKKLRNQISEKCRFKDISFPPSTGIERQHREISQSWGPMLGHQLPLLPDPTMFLTELQNFFAWLDGQYQPNQPLSIPSASEYTLVSDRRLPSIMPLKLKSSLELFRFAAANRLCVDLSYRRQTKEVVTERIEPYWLCRNKMGELSILGVQCKPSIMTFYSVKNIAEISVTQQQFTPHPRDDRSPMWVER